MTSPAQGPAALAHPFRFGPNGRAVTVERDSDADVAQQITMLLTTEVQDRPLAPTFGIEDPAFTGGVDPALIAAAVAVNVPQAAVGNVTVDYPNDGLALVTVEFSVGAADDQP